MKPSASIALLFTSCCLLASACSENHLQAVVDGGADGGQNSDAGASDGGHSDGGNGNCTASASYGTVDAGADQQATYDSQNDIYDYLAPLNADALPDLLDMQLYAGTGVFANGVVPGTYHLTGDELDYATCGLCLLVYGNYDASSNHVPDTYFATGGTVVITQVTPTLIGKLTNVTFTHVTIDSATYQSTPVGDGCVSKIVELDFSALLDGGSGACTASADYGTVDPSASEAAQTDGTGDYDYTAALNADATPDVLDLQLYAGAGVFANGVVPGTYQLTGDELSYATCGLCLLVYTDVDTGAGSYTDTYFATGGTVTITQVTPNLMGTLTHVTFTHVNIDATTLETVPAGDGCDAKIDSLTFNTPSGGGGGGACTAATGYGTVDPSATEVAIYDPALDVYEYTANLNADAAPDVVHLQLWSGFGIFANGVVPGAYQITGGETQYSSCGLCLLIATDTDATGTPADTYLATGGTVVITQVTPTLQGRLTNVTFTHVTIDDTGTSTPVGDGCDAKIDSLTFNAPVGSGADCTASADYGTVDPSATQAATYDSNYDLYGYTADLNSDPDALDMQLYNGLGVFANGVVPGTYTLGGDELNYATCGLCLLIFTDNNGGDVYFATGGTVVITQVTPKLIGMLTNVTFTHVNIDPQTYESTPVGDGCDSIIEELDFNAPIGGAAGGACTATADYGTVTPTGEEAISQNGSYEYDAQLNTDAAPDLVVIELVKGYGVFASAVKTGTYTLTGDELNYATCGLCIRILTDLDANGKETDDYFATGGTVNISQINGTLTGTLTNLTFEHVTIDSTSYQSTPVADGCGAKIGAMAFSASDPASARSSRGAARHDVRAAKSQGMAPALQSVQPGRGLSSPGLARKAGFASHHGRTILLAGQPGKSAFLAKHGGLAKRQAKASAGKLVRAHQVEKQRSRAVRSALQSVRAKQHFRHGKPARHTAKRLAMHALHARKK